MAKSACVSVRDRKQSSVFERLFTKPYLWTLDRLSRPISPTWFGQRHRNEMGGGRAVANCGARAAGNLDFGNE